MLFVIDMSKPKHYENSLNSFHKFAARILPQIIQHQLLLYLADSQVNTIGNWDISMGGVDYYHFVALISTDDNFVDYESDEYTTFYPRSLICCRIVAITIC